MTRSEINKIDLIALDLYQKAQERCFKTRLQKLKPIFCKTILRVVIFSVLTFSSFTYAAETLDTHPESQATLVHDEASQNSETFNKIFHSHLSQNASTLAPGKWSFQPYPAASSANSFFANSISVGLSRRFEVGTIPIYWMLSQPTVRPINANFKYNFYHTEKHDFSLAYSLLYFHFVIPASPGINTEITTDNKFQDFGYLYTYRYSSNLSVSLNYFMHRLTQNLSSDTGQNIDLNLDAKPDIMIDVETRLSSRLFLTTGVAFAPADGTSVYFSQGNHWGEGMTITWERPGKFFSAPSLGAHYVPDLNTTRMLLSSSFY